MTPLKIIGIAALAFGMAFTSWRLEYAIRVAGVARWKAPR